MKKVSIFIRFFYKSIERLIVVFHVNARIHTLNTQLFITIFVSFAESLWSITPIKSSVTLLSCKEKTVKSSENNLFVNQILKCLKNNSTWWGFNTPSHPLTEEGHCTPCHDPLNSQPGSIQVISPN